MIGVPCNDLCDQSQRQKPALADLQKLCIAGKQNYILNNKAFGFGQFKHIATPKFKSTLPFLVIKEASVHLIEVLASTAMVLSVVFILAVAVTYDAV